MEQVKSFCRRYRRLLLAAAYLAIFAVGVLYLRVTVNIPPEGDDKLTLNLWLYDFQRMPFWQYALQDLQGRLRYFTLQEVRFFPFHYPNAVDLLFYTSLTHYRLYIIAWTGAAAFAVSRVAARLGSGDALALGGFALALAAAPIWNEGMYSYYAVPQRALFWAMTAWLCLFAWQGTRHRRWAVLGAVLSFIACGTYEIGYVFALLALVVWLLRRRSVKNALLDTAPALGGMGAALVFHVLCGRNGGTGNELSLDIPAVLRVTVQQMAASLPGLNSRLLQEDAGVITNGDRLWPLALGVLAGLLIFFGVPFKKLRSRTLGALAGFGLAVWALPALLLALSARYQQPEAITWQWGYIPAAASSIGFTLLAAALLALLAGLCCKLPKVLSVVSRLALTAALGLFALRRGAGELRLYCLLGAMGGAVLQFACFSPLLAPLWDFWAQTAEAAVRLALLPLRWLGRGIKKVEKFRKNLFYFWRKWFTIRKIGAVAHRRRPKGGKKHGEGSERTQGGVRLPRASCDPGTAGAAGLAGLADAGPADGGQGPGAAAPATGPDPAAGERRPAEKHRPGRQPGGDGAHRPG